jgi:hypothetical protein
LLGVVEIHLLVLSLYGQQGPDRYSHTNYDRLEYTNEQTGADDTMSTGFEGESSKNDGWIMEILCSKHLRDEHVRKKKTGLAVQIVTTNAVWTERDIAQPVEIKMPDQYTSTLIKLSNVRTRQISSR